MFYTALFGTRGSVAGVAVLLARESTASEPLVASVRNVEPQVYLLLQNEAESRCSTTDQISRPWSKSKRPITCSLLAGFASSSGDTKEQQKIMDRIAER